MSWQKCRCGLQVGPAHIIFLNHYTPFDKASDQYKWAVADLADAFDPYPVAAGCVPCARVQYVR